MAITWDEVLSGTDLVDELVPPPMPKLKALLSQPTVFYESTNFRGVQHPVGPEPVSARPQTDAEAVFDAHLAATGRTTTPTRQTGFAQWCSVCDAPLSFRERNKDYGGKCEKHAKTASCRDCSKAIVPFYHGDPTTPKVQCDRCKNNAAFKPETDRQLDDPLCEICTWPKSHVRHYNRDLHNFHEYEEEHPAEQEAGFPTAEQEYTTEPISDGGVSEDLLAYGGFGQELEQRGVTRGVEPSDLERLDAARKDGYRDSHFAGDLVDLVENEPSISEILQAQGFGARIYDGLETPDGKRVVFERGPFQAPEMARPRIVDDATEDMTDAERRERAAELFGIDPSTMTEDRLEGLR